MTAIFNGPGAGFARSSATVLGGQGLLGSASTGRAGENLMVNASTGNLVITRQDEFLSGPAEDMAVSRTYNSLAEISDWDNNDKWQMSTVRKLFGLTGTLNTTGSTIKRQAGDGSVVTYSYGTRNGLSAYWTTDGEGAHDKLVNASGIWTWTDGATQFTEVYQAIVGETGAYRIYQSKDLIGNALTYGYTATSGLKLSTVTAANGEKITYSWSPSGINITQVDVTIPNPNSGNQLQTWKRTKYGYDAYDRLQTVTIDLSPGFSSWPDDHIYTLSYEYNGPNGLISAVTQNDGSRTDISYDAQGRVTQLKELVADGESRTTRIGYGVNTTSVTAPNDEVTRLWYDNKGQLVQLMAPPATKGGVSQVRQFEYDQDGNLLRTIETDSVNASTPDNLVLASGWGDGEEADRGDNLVDDSGWPQDFDSALPANGTIGTGWTTGYIAETEWVPMTGPYGTNIVGLRAGQNDSASGAGGGALSNPVSIDAKKTYEFTYYFKLNGPAVHSIYFGGPDIWNGSPGYVDYAHSGENTINPYFLSLDPTAQNSLFQVGKWYKVVGYVLPEGSANITPFSLGGVYDTDTGARLSLNTNAFRWSSQRVANDGFTRFFNYYGTDIAKRTDFYKPGMREVADAAILRGSDKLDIVKDRNLVEAPLAPGWSNVPSYNSDNEARWSEVTGPDGAWQMAMQTGQFDTGADGGGGVTNYFAVDPSKTYRFTQYVRKSDLSRHNIYFGLSGGSYVKYAVSGADATNPYFLQWSDDTQRAYLQEDRWYKLVGYVLPQGSANIASYNLGGIYDAVSGARAGDLYSFRWHESIPNNQVIVRFFTFYDETQPGWSTDWLAPEVVQIANASLAADNAKPFGIAYDEGGRITSYQYDTMGNVTLIDRPIGSDVTRTYDGGNRATFEQATGSNENAASIAHYTRYAYGTNGLLRYRVGPNGRVTEYRYLTSGTTNGQVQYQVEYLDDLYAVASTPVTETDLNTWRDDPLKDKTRRSITTFYYDTRGNLIQMREHAVADASGNPTTVEGYTDTFFARDQHGRLLSTYKNGEQLDSFVYDGLNRIIASSSPSAGVTSIYFEDASTTTVMHLASGLNRALTYNKAGDLISEVESTLGAMKAPQFTALNAWTAEGVGTPTDTTNAAGQPARQYVTDGSQFGNVYASISVEGGDTLRFRFTVKATSTGSINGHRFGLYATGDEDGYGTKTDSAAVIVNGLGRLTQIQGGLWQLDGVSTTTETTIEIVRTFSQTQDVVASLRIGEAIGEVPAGIGLIFSGQSVVKTDGYAELAFTSVTTNSYDKLGRLRVSYDQFDNGNRTYFLYDNAGRKTAEVNDYGEMVEFFYDSNNRLVGTARYNNRVSSTYLALAYLQDPNNTLTAAGIRPTANPTQDERSWTVYDALGRVVQTINGEGEVTSLEYDGMGRVVRTIAYATRITFPASAPLTPVYVGPDTANDRVSRNFYDLDGNLRATHDGEGYLVEYVYDARGRKIEQIAYAQAATGSTLDALKTSAGTTHVDNRRTRFIYDARGILRYQLNEFRDAGGLVRHLVTTFSYNLAGKLTTTIVHAGSIATPSNFKYATVKVAVVADTTNDRRSFAVLNAKGQVAYSIDATSQVTGFTYDAAGRVIKTVRYATIYSTTAVPPLTSMDNWAAGAAVANHVDKPGHAATGTTPATSCATRSMPKGI